MESRDQIIISACKDLSGTARTLREALAVARPASPGVKDLYKQLKELYCPAVRAALSRVAAVDNGSRGAAAVVDIILPLTQAMSECRAEVWQWAQLSRSSQIFNKLDLPSMLDKMSAALHGCIQSAIHLVDDLNSHLNSRPSAPCAEPGLTSTEPGLTSPQELPEAADTALQELEGLEEVGKVDKKRVRASAEIYQVAQQLKELEGPPWHDALRSLGDSMTRFAGWADDIILALGIIPAILRGLRVSHDAAYAHSLTSLLWRFLYNDRLRSNLLAEGYAADLVATLNSNRSSYNRKGAAASALKELSCQPNTRVALIAAGAVPALGRVYTGHATSMIDNILASGAGILVEVWGRLGLEDAQSLALATSAVTLLLDTMKHSKAELQLHACKVLNDLCWMEEGALLPFTQAGVLSTLLALIKEGSQVECSAQHAAQEHVQDDSRGNVQPAPEDDGLVERESGQKNDRRVETQSDLKSDLKSGLKSDLESGLKSGLVDDVASAVVGDVSMTEPMDHEGSSEGAGHDSTNEAVDRKGVDEAGVDIGNADAVDGVTAVQANEPSSDCDMLDVNGNSDQSNSNGEQCSDESSPSMAEQRVNVMISSVAKLTGHQAIFDEFQLHGGLDTVLRTLKRFRRSGYSSWPTRLPDTVVKFLRERFCDTEAGKRLLLAAGAVQVLAPVLRESVGAKQNHEVAQLLFDLVIEDPSSQRIIEQEGALHVLAGYLNNERALEDDAVQEDNDEGAAEDVVAKDDARDGEAQKDASGEDAGATSAADVHAAVEDESMGGEQDEEENNIEQHAQDGATQQQVKKAAVYRILKACASHVDPLVDLIRQRTAYIIRTDVVGNFDTDNSAKLEETKAELQRLISVLAILSVRYPACRSAAVQARAIPALLEAFNNCYERYKLDMQHIAAWALAHFLDDDPCALQALADAGSLPAVAAAMHATGLEHQPLSQTARAKHAMDAIIDACAKDAKGLFGFIDRVRLAVRDTQDSQVEGKASYTVNVGESYQAHLHLSRLMSLLRMLLKRSNGGSFRAAATQAGLIPTLLRFFDEADEGNFGVVAATVAYVCQDDPTSQQAVVGGGDVLHRVTEAGLHHVRWSSDEELVAACKAMQLVCAETGCGKCLKRKREEEGE